MSRFFKSFLVGLVFLISLTQAKYWQLGERKFNLAKCVSQLIDDEQINHTRNIRISVKTEPGLARFISGDIINQIRVDAIHTFVAFDVLPTSDGKSFYEIHTRLIIVDSYNSFRDLLQRQRKTSSDIHGLRQYYYILLTDYKEGTNTIQKILDLCLENYIVNVNLIVEDSEGMTTIYTYFPFTEDSCRTSRRIIYNRFVDGKFQWNRPVFPRKLKNLWMCPIRAVVWHKPPYILLKNQQVSGIDGRFILFLSKTMNFTLELVDSPEGIGEVHPNGTKTGAFKIIEDGKGDLLIGGTVCTKSRRKHLACTRNYLTTSAQIIIKKPEPYNSEEILFLPFDRQTWRIILIVVFINLIVRGLWKRIANSFNGSGILSTRIQAISWLWSIFIIESSYGGSIFEFIHNHPQRRAPQSFEEAIAEGYTFIFKSTFLPLIKHIPQLKNQFILSENSPLELLDEFDQYHGKYALINLANYLTILANNSTRYRQYVEIKEPFLYYVMCAYLPRFSFLTEEINHLINVMVNHGHLSRFYDISVTDKLREIKSIPGSYIKAIKLLEMKGTFAGLTVISIKFGFFFLLIEFLAMKIMILKKIVDFLHLIIS